jgi:hypothetical protein
MTINGNANDVQGIQNTDASGNSNANVEDITVAGNADGASVSGNASAQAAPQAADASSWQAASMPDYGSNVPSATWKKSDIREWLDDKGFVYDDGATKAELLEMIP